MKKTNFVTGLNERDSDLEKLFFHVYYDAMKDFIKKSKNRKRSIIFFSVLAVLGALLLFIPEMFGFAIFMVIAGVIVAIFSAIQYRNLKISSRVKKIGLVEVPFLQSNLRDKSVLVDLSGLVEETTFEFPSLDNEQIQSLNQENQSVKQLVYDYPIVISPDEERQISRNQDLDKEHLKIYTEEIDLLNRSATIQDLVDNPRTQSVSLPAMENDPPMLNYLKKHHINGDHPRVEHLAQSEARERIQRIDGIVDSSVPGDQGPDIDKLCFHLRELYKQVLPRYQYTLDNSLERVMNKSHLLNNYHFHHISNNYYCPHCNEEALHQIESGDYLHNDNNQSGKVEFNGNTRMQLIDIESLRWKCPLCGKETNEPIARNKLDDELFTPVYDKLYEENFKERLKIYNDINDQKRQYAEKASTQFHQVLRESRSKEDQIKSQIRSISAEISAEQSSVAQLNDMLVKYEQINRQRSREIEADINNIKKDVKKENEKAKREINETVESAKKDISETTKKYAALEREDQAKRDAVQRQMAEDTRKMREVEEVRAERDGMNKRRGPFGILRSERQKTRNKRMKK